MYRRRFNFMHNILLVAVRLGSEAAIWRQENACYFMMRKALKNSSREVYFLVRVQVTGL